MSEVLELAAKIAEMPGGIEWEEGEVIYKLSVCKGHTYTWLLQHQVEPPMDGLIACKYNPKDILERQILLSLLERWARLELEKAINNERVFEMNYAIDAGGGCWQINVPCIDECIYHRDYLTALLLAVKKLKETEHA